MTARFNRPMAYRAIRPLARFHDDYRAIDEMVLNSKTFEASSSLSFDTVKRGGEFHTHPRRATKGLEGHCINRKWRQITAGLTEEAT